MTYQINYLDEATNKWFCVFDVEYYLTKSEIKEDFWFSEIHVLPILDGFSKFLFNKIYKKYEDNEEKFQEFLDETNQIQELRCLLYERYNNKPKPHKEASEFHYHSFGDILREILESYVKKYGLSLNID